MFWIIYKCFGRFTSVRCSLHVSMSSAYSYRYNRCLDESTLVTVHNPKSCSAENVRGKKCVSVEEIWPIWIQADWVLSLVKNTFCREFQVCISFNRVLAFSEYNASNLSILFIRHLFISKVFLGNYPYMGRKNIVLMSQFLKR